MQLLHLSLTNFKNIAEANLEFSPKINCLLGNNGMGKSNLLDAIYYLSFCKSFSGMTDGMLMRKGEDFLMARARYMRRDTPEELILGMTRGKRKSLKREPAAGNPGLCGHVQDGRSLYGGGHEALSKRPGGYE